MAYTKRMVCLANSFKTGGSCIAGREVLANGKYGGWIRPISARPTAELTYSEYKYQNNMSPKLLDIIDVPLLKADPHHHQTENHIVAGSDWWVKVGELPLDELEKLHERPESLWINSDHTGGGRLNCISQSEAFTLQDSLVLIKRKEFIVEVGSKSWGGKTTKTYRGKFKYKGTDYCLNITDPLVTAAFKASDEGEYALANVYLCISLTEPWEKDNNRCHKLVAAVFKHPPF